jgi:hypothetical protein
MALTSSQAKSVQLLLYALNVSLQLTDLVLLPHKVKFLLLLE